MSDLDELLGITEDKEENKKNKKNLFNGDKREFTLNKNEEKEVNTKLEHFLIKKKINIIRKRVKEHFFLVLAFFSIILVTIPLSFLVYHYFNPYSHKIITYNSKNTNNLAENLNNIPNNISNDNYSKENNGTGKNILNSGKNKYEVISLSSTIDEIKKTCNNNLTCYIKKAYQNKDPGICVISPNRKECLKAYNELIYEQTPDYKLKELYLKLKNNEISVDDLKKYNVSVETLIYFSGDPSLCKYLTDEERKKVSLCNS